MIFAQGLAVHLVSEDYLVFGVKSSIQRNRDLEWLTLKVLIHSCGNQMEMPHLIQISLRKSRRRKNIANQDTLVFIVTDGSKVPIDPFDARIDFSRVPPPVSSACYLCDDFLSPHAF